MRALLLILFLIALALPAAAQNRIALVIGNGAYRSVERLPNPANDARLVAATLRDAGFTLIGGGPQIDLDKAAFDHLVQTFGQALQGADTALFYYSGHGMQVAGTNWLIPVDAHFASIRDLDFQAVDADLVLHQMNGAGTKLNLVILDACRNNPFPIAGTRGVGGGLAQMHAPEGTLISYATQPGAVALDGQGANSPYSAALVAAMRQPGLDVFQVFNRVGLAVQQATSGEQQPWVASSPISGSFAFFAPATPGAQSTALNEDALFWQSIASTNNPAELRAYLARYPTGTFAELARTRLAAFAPPAPPKLSPPNPAPALDPVFAPPMPPPNLPPTTTPALPQPEEPAQGSCRISVVHGMLTPGGADGTMLVTAARPCGGRLAIAEGVPYDALVLTELPRSGIVELYGSNGFRYRAAPGFRGTVNFTIVGTGMDNAGHPRTGRLRMHVTVAP